MRGMGLPFYNESNFVEQIAWSLWMYETEHRDDTTPIRSWESVKGEFRERAEYVCRFLDSVEANYWRVKSA